MVLLSSHVCRFGWRAVPFLLLGTDGNIHSLERCAGPNGTLVVFMCNHCPYVLGCLDRLSADARVLKEEHGVHTVAINPNDSEAYPDDSFDRMQALAKERDLPFPYLVDPSQDLAYAYGALCTPDFFGFNKNLELQYRGRLDGAGTTPNAPRGNLELLEAMVLIAKTGKGPQEQQASMGCSIKWRADSPYVQNGNKVDPRSASADLPLS